MTKQHTPLPWNVGQDTKGQPMIFADGYEVLILSKFNRTQEEAEANAAFIVRAVNSHEKLVTSIKHLLEAQFVMDEMLTSPVKLALDEVRAALALATEKE